MAARRTVVLNREMPTLESFHSSAVDRQQLSTIMRDYLALERARVYRRLFVARFGVLALVLGVTGVGFRWLSAFAAWFSVGLCLVAPLWAWIAELRCDWRLSRHLDQVPQSPARSAPERKS